MRIPSFVSDPRNPGSLASALRRRRFRLFARLIARLPRPLAILDVGGEFPFWRTMDFLDQEGVTITLLNVSHAAARLPGGHTGGTAITVHLGSALSMPEFADKQFDVVFSNSVIEHVGGLERQRAAADEIRRVAKRYFIQTPHRWFPIEPHFHFPFFQLLPIAARVALVQHLPLGWFRRLPSREEAEKAVRSIHLLTARELRLLYPEASIYIERLLGLPKSLVAYAGW